jgi:uncharacterized protein (DUF2249 family)
MNNNIVTLDVREDIKSGREPFSKIMSAVATLGAGQELLLVAPFEPVPLFAVLAKQGFQHSARQIAAAHWEVRFIRGSGNDVARPAVRSSINNEQSAILDVDARNLEPPQPMVKILETLESLPNGAELRARTDRRPIHLYAHLEERGFTAASEEQPDGSFITHIHRA